MGSRRYSEDLPQDDLEIPCTQRDHVAPLTCHDVTIFLLIQNFMILIFAAADLSAKKCKILHHVKFPAIQ